MSKTWARAVQPSAVIAVVLAVILAITDNNSADISNLAMCGLVLLSLLILLGRSHKELSEFGKGVAWIAFAAWYSLATYYYANYASICFPGNAPCHQQLSATHLASTSVFLVSIWVYIRRLPMVSVSRNAFSPYMLVTLVSAAPCAYLTLTSPPVDGWLDLSSELITSLITLLITFLIACWQLRALKVYRRDLAKMQAQNNEL